MCFMKVLFENANGSVSLQKEMLTKELERERQLRLESEQKVLQLTNECGNYKEKVSTVENDLKK